MVFEGHLESTIPTISCPAWHDLQGVFMACGPDIRDDNSKLTNLKIYDITPTVLHMFGLPATTEMDGRVLTEIFKPDSEEGKRAVTYKQASEKDRATAKVKV